MQGIIINHYPDVLQQIEDIRQIAKAEDIEFEKLRNAIRESSRNMFVSTASEQGIKRLEKMLGIIPKAAQGLEERKSYILYMMNRRKMSLSELEELLSGYSKGIRLKVDYYNEELTVEVDGRTDNLEVIQEILDSLLPLQIYIQFEIYINMWRLDGVERLNGTKALDAEIIKKEFE